MRKLAHTLGFAKGTYDLRSQRAGIASAGDITLHTETIYVQVNQSALGPLFSILVRTCKGRRDYTGGANHFAPIDLLDDIPTLAREVRKVLAAHGGIAHP